MYTSEDNWYQWQYDNDPLFGRQTGGKELKTIYTKMSRPLMSFKEELIEAAKSTLDHYSGLRPCVFFSGGVDSELILRSYLAIGSNPKVYIIRYENDINIYDVSYAVTVCSILNVQYDIVDFNLQKFYENDAMQIAEEAQIDRPGMLPHLKFTECADGLIIVGHSDVRWYRTDNDYTKKGTWLMQDFEHDLGCDKYNILHNRPAIFQWFKWSPGLVLGYTKLEWFINLVNDKYYGKLGINSTKILGFREMYPEMIERIKQTGFEKTYPLILEFEETLNTKFNGLPYRACIHRTLDQLYGEILNINWPHQLATDS
jgi:hypothetical protein